MVLGLSQKRNGSLSRPRLGRELCAWHYDFHFAMRLVSRDGVAKYRQVGQRPRFPVAPLKFSLRIPEHRVENRAEFT